MSDPWNGCIYPHLATDTCPGCSSEYDTPRWERVLLAVVLVLLVLVVLSGILTAVVR